jgi:H+/Cl- antiporter ClcA
MIKNAEGVYEKQTLTVEEKRHETWHVWQQLCLFALGLVCAFVTNIALRIAAVPYAWLAWCLPIVMPLGIYVLCWVAELILPPWATAYKNICFESEAQFHEFDENPRYIPFSFLLFIPNFIWTKGLTYYGIGRDYFYGTEAAKQRLREKHRFLRILGY